MSLTVADLITEIKKRLGGESSPRLVQLTNHGSASTIEENTLEGACADSIGAFRIETLQEPDNVDTHIQSLIFGVIFFLESYKGRNTDLMRYYEKKFYLTLKSIGDRKYILPSALIPEDEDSTDTYTGGVGNI